jgi:3-oxoacyl-[acyl-carrier protein] reductase
MDLGLNGKVAVILASSKGLGLACAKGFYEEGASVVVCSRSKENLLKAKEIIKDVKTGDSQQKILNLVVNLTDEDQIKAMIDIVIKEFGTIDILVHNAGGPPSAPISQISMEQWEESISLNLKSFIIVCKAVVPIMQNQQFGRIIAITSVSIKQPLNNLVLSNTTRLGVLGFAKTLANEYAKDNILVNVVCP